MLGGTMTLLAGKPTPRSPIYLKLTPAALQTLATPGHQIYLAEGASPVLRIGEELHALEVVDDPCPFDIVTSGGDDALTLEGATAMRYTMRADLAQAASRMRERNEAIEHDREAHRSVRLDNVGVDKRGRSVSPAPLRHTLGVANAARAASPRGRPSSNAAYRPASLLAVASSGSAPLKKATDANSLHGRPSASSATASTSSNASSTSSTTSSNETASTRPTSVSPNASDAESKARLPEVVVSSPIKEVAQEFLPTRSSASPVKAPRTVKPDIHQIDQKGGDEKAPRIAARTSTGTRISKPLRRSPSTEVSEKRLERSVSPAAAAPPSLVQLAANDDPLGMDSAARAAALASVSVKKRKLSPHDGAPVSSSQHGTPSSSRPGTPILGAGPAKRSRNPREEIWYSSSDDDEERPHKTSRLEEGQLDSKRAAEAKSLTDRRVAALVKGEDVDIRHSRSDGGARERGRHSRTPSLNGPAADRASTVPRLEIRSTEQFVELAAKFEEDRTRFEVDRKRLVDLRADIQLALKTGKTADREEGLMHVGRGDLHEASRRARRRHDELAEIKAALQRWIDDHDQ